MSLGIKMMKQVEKNEKNPYNNNIKKNRG